MKTPGLGGGPEGFEKQLAFARSVRELLERDGPRSHDGELLAPYGGWAKRLLNDIMVAEAWLRKDGGNHGG